MNQPATSIEQRWTTPDGVQLAGTLQLPRRKRQQTVPGVLLINGSGPLDRDSNTEGQTLDIAAAFAEHLASLGIASLRFDKRGTGSSEGDYGTVGFHDEYHDAGTALHHLADVDEIDAGRIAVVGHSVGATVAIRLAASEPTVAAVVLLAAASSPGERVLEWQSDRIGRTLPGPDWLTGRIFRAMQRRSRAKLTKPDAQQRAAAQAPVSGRWLREYAAYDPADDLAQVGCPVLAITGAKDLQVDPAELATIAALVTGPCRTEAPADLTHILRSTTDEPRITGYRKLLDAPVDPDLLATVGAWLSTTVDPDEPHSDPESSPPRSAPGDQH